MSALISVTFAPIAAELQRYYGVTAGAVDSLTALFMVVYIVTFIPMALILEHLGLTAGMVVGALLTFIGAALRFLGAGRDGFNMVLLGSVVAALGQPLFLNAPAALSAEWFAPEERST
jgi:fucose permease